MDYLNVFSAFSTSSNSQIYCGVLVIKHAGAHQYKQIYHNELAMNLLGLSDNTSGMLLSLEELVPDSELQRIVLSLQPGESKEPGSYRIAGTDVYVYRDEDDYYYIHLYQLDLLNIPDQNNDMQKPMKFMFMFDASFSLIGLSPSDEYQHMFPRALLIGKKPDEIFSSEMGLAIMDGMIQARKKGKEEYSELFSADGKQRVLFHFSSQGEKEHLYYFAFLDYFPGWFKNDPLQFNIDQSFRILLDELPNVVIIHQEGIIVYANKEAGIMSGIAPSDLLGRHVLSQIPTSYHAIVGEMVSRRNSGEMVPDYQIEVYGPEKVIKTAIVRSSMVVFEGRPSSLIILHDITEMKMLEHQMMAKHTETETIINSISSGVIIIDAETHLIQKVNKAAINLIGGSEEMIIGRECNDFVCPNAKGCCPIEKNHTLFESAEKQIKRINGECIPILKTVTLFDYNGRDCYLESFVDIRELKKNEDIIRRKERIFSAIAELTDELLKNTDYNDALRQKLHLLGEATGVDRIYMFENDRDEYGMSVSCSQKIEWAAATAEPQIDNPELQEIPFEAIEVFIQPLKENKPFKAIIRELEESYTKEALTAQDIQSILVLPLTVNDRFWGFVGFDECKSERTWSDDEFSILLAFAGTLSAAIERRMLEHSLKQSMELAQQANKAKSEFLANMSHEIRTPLNAVIGFTDLLLTTRLDETQSDYLRSVNNSAIILLDLINDILDYSKIEAGKLELFTEKTDLRELVSQISDIVRFKAHAKHLEFLINVAEHLPSVVIADGIRLRQVLINLLWNAIKFTEKGEVELSIDYKSTDDHHGLFYFTVRDTGIGIEKEKQAIIFEAFSQADTSTTRRFGGTGLGLPISLNLIRKMNSELQLESIPGEGTTFSFTLHLPVSADVPEEQEPMSSIKHVSVVDDNKQNLSILRRMLQNMKYEVILYENPKEALNQADQKTDLWIIDYEMPEINGIELITQLKKSSTASFILLHSSADDPLIRDEGRRLGLTQILTKPITSRQLIQAIEGQVFMPAEPSISNKKESFSDSKSHKIMIVEDNPVNMKLAMSLINHVIPGADMYNAENGAEAVRMYQMVMPDLIFMDIQMPVMNGYEATKQIRLIEKDLKVNQAPVIALTAGIISESREKAFESGMNDFLSKPLLLQGIESVTQKWLCHNRHNNKNIQNMQNQNEHFDRSAFSANTLGNAELMAELINISRETMPQYVDELLLATRQLDRPKIKERAHALKGQALTMQCRNLAGLSRLLEEAALSAEAEQLSQLASDIETETQLLLSDHLI